MADLAIENFSKGLTDAIHKHPVFAQNQELQKASEGHRCTLTVERDVQIIAQHVQTIQALIQTNAEKDKELEELKGFCRLLEEQVHNYQTTSGSLFALQQAIATTKRELESMRLEKLQLQAASRKRSGSAGNPFELEDSGISEPSAKRVKPVSNGQQQAKPSPLIQQGKPSPFAPHGKPSPFSQYGKPSATTQRVNVWPFGPQPQSTVTPPVQRQPSPTAKHDTIVDGNRIKDSITSDSGSGFYPGQTSGNRDATQASPLGPTMPSQARDAPALAPALSVPDTGLPQTSAPNMDPASANSNAPLNSVQSNAAPVATMPQTQPPQSKAVVASKIAATTSLTALDKILLRNPGTTAEPTFRLRRNPLTLFDDSTIPLCLQQYLNNRKTAWAGGRLGAPDNSNWYEKLLKTPSEIKNCLTRRFCASGGYAEWTVEDKTKYACKYCVNHCLPCCVWDATINKIVVLPLHQDLREAEDMNVAGYWLKSTLQCTLSNKSAFRQLFGAKVEAANGGDA
ncbi:hypothetical protein LTR56_008779 [Elasticomyces elasticus]|nr:hypothetical protein LTR22_017564 [Elasticomyces elasticus]KAK3646161.1 hypothetical protein LTR56_008779 [Elasticomyces elasticus]KAK4924342.1 hypothetical protein LTR49_008643 [Elasticomyces elasticus]KAK5759099.1 hypothetical protein LTS12_010707 [Elasticomyces elasticus]